MSGVLSSTIRMVHIPKFRSARPVWMYHELKAIYGTKMPEMEITTFTDIPSFRNNKPQWLLDMNPNGKVPAMAHGPICMFEGGAMCSYLLDLYDTDRKLLPNDPQAVSTYHLLVSWCASTLDNLIATSSPISIALDSTSAKYPVRSTDTVATNRKYFDEIFVPYLMKQLTVTARGGGFLCGESFTAADVIVGFYLLMAKDSPKPTWLEEERYPEILAYYERLKSRPAFQKAISPVEG
jgi:glutathione S-transferase